ncbi:amidohydrolase family protein [Methylocystis sp. Sn-Cys]|uniref:amidohydrolase family protein n=1 Tax=Methylocystis sp. Sn-Cys TaxID=1701263 RepID=UPI0019218B7F|nr:amidohydrolase family protein [Methylocystis sp. Sn-Cys]MBL1256638.1 amidohydrolase [Methylocystis sp. Sn-Cys]
MDGKIGLEEHFGTADFLHDSEGVVPADRWDVLKSRILDIHDRRLRLMDEYGMEMMILSLTSPGIQEIPDAPTAIETARRLNDYLAEQVAKRPDRFQGFAALPMQDPDAACVELERCIGALGFRGALVNGFTELGADREALYYDMPRYRPFWALMEQLGAPFYLHPRNPLPRNAGVYEGQEWLMGPTWAFGSETAVHALRLMGSGLFDEHPGLAIIMGHLGEGLPYSIWRVDHHNAWAKAPPKHKAKRGLRDYFQENFYLTTSGNFHTPTLMCAIAELGADHVLFSTDWPFENIDQAALWFDAVDMSEGDRRKIGRTNAQKLFKLGGDGA